jgi:hypothetical protein
MAGEAEKLPYPVTLDGSLPEEYKYTLDPLDTLSFAAARTSKIKLGTSVLDMPYSSADLHCSVRPRGALWCFNASHIGGMPSGFRWHCRRFTHCWLWFVKIPEAPFPYHMVTFHADRTVRQAKSRRGKCQYRRQ